MRLTPDMTEAKHWIYPLNRPKRDYQYNIVRHCLFDNTLVALPTGLGKTFIAGVVMLNCMWLASLEIHLTYWREKKLDFRWFPYGKIIFSAPTKPLVAQQITACHEVCGIPRQDAVELTGNTPRATRARHVSNFPLSSLYFIYPR
jgi:ATP-dependent DNA helicase MPH1